MPRFCVLPLVLVGACAPRGGIAPARPGGAEGRPVEVSPREPRPTLRLPGGVRPTRAAVELWLVPGAATFRGTIELEIDLADARAIVWLHAQELRVSEARFTVGAERLPARVVPGGAGFLGFAPERPIGPGRATLWVAYEGRVDSDFEKGLSSGHDGDADYLYSQFEPIAARRAFPCFDEPGFKIPWRIGLHVKREHRAFANTRQLFESLEEGGMKRVEFAETRPLPAYLVAVAVGPFDVVEAAAAGAGHTPVRIVLPRGHAAEAGYAAGIAPRIVEALEDYFGTPFPYDKLDLVAAPHAFDFAMENPGFITFSLPMLALGPKQQTVGKRRYLALVTAHEIAHQWFGDSVTLAWWDDLWLNEAFANWIEARIVERVEPRLGGFRDPIDNREQAFRSDGLRAARRIRQPIASESDIYAAFDAITYSKGAAVLGMIEGWIGGERFQRAVRSYLERHRDGNARSSDFLAAVGDAGGRDAAGVFADFLDQSGVPEVALTLRCGAGGAELALSQRRYLPVSGSGDGDSRRWRIPVCLRFGAGHSIEQRCDLLDGPTATVRLGAACPEWVLAAADERRYYHVAYRGGMLGALIAHRELLTVSERIGLVSDVEAMARSGALPIGEALAAWETLAADPSPHVAGATLGFTRTVADWLLPDPPPADFARWVSRVYGGRASALGFSPRAGEDEAAHMLRPELLSLVLDYGADAALRRDALRLAREWLDAGRGGAARSAGPGGLHDLDADLVPIVLATAAVDGDRSLYDRMVEAARATSDPAEREPILHGLSSFGDPALERDALGAVASGAFSVADGPTVLYGAARRPRTRAIAWGFVTEHVDALIERLPQSVGSALPHLFDGLCDAEHRAALRTLFQDRVARMPGGAQALDESLEMNDQCASLRAAQGAAALGYFSRPGSAKPGARGRVRPHNGGGKP